MLIIIKIIIIIIIMIIIIITIIIIIINIIITSRETLSWIMFQEILRHDLFFDFEQMFVLILFK